MTQEQPGLSGTGACKYWPPATPARTRAGAWLGLLHLTPPYCTTSALLVRLHSTPYTHLRQPRLALASPTQSALLHSPTLNLMHAPTLNLTHAPALALGSGFSASLHRLRLPALAPAAAAAAAAMDAAAAAGDWVAYAGAPPYAPAPPLLAGIDDGRPMLRVREERGANADGQGGAECGARSAGTLVDRQKLRRLWRWR